MIKIIKPRNGEGYFLKFYHSTEAARYYNSYQLIGVDRVDLLELFEQLKKKESQLRG
jgi:hypothetical protein